MSETGKDQTRFSFLFKKYINETCSVEEAQEIAGILGNSENDNSLKNEAGFQWNSLSLGINEDLIPVENRLIMDRILDRLHHRIRLQEEESIGKHFRLNRFFGIFARVAAVIILPLLVYSIYLTSKTLKNTQLGASQAVLQTIKTPVGMQTDFLLPDGSHVWLNSGSVFKYPVSFAKDTRQVELIGEAFFDVVKDASHPFLVKAGKMNVEVKGTRFNIINYPEEPLTELILESGSVRLFSGDYNNQKTIALIKPGQLAILDNAQNKLSVSDVDVEKYTAWKEGMLIFREEQMDEVARKLNRWFNVEIVLQSSELKDYVYTATYRDETLPQILELLKISAPIKYNIIERKRLPDNSYSKRKIIITKRK